MELRDIVNLLIVLSVVLGPLIFKKSQDATKRGAAARRPQPRPPQAPRETGSGQPAPADDLLRRLEEEFFGGAGRRAPADPVAAPPQAETPPEVRRERPPPPRAAPRERRPAPAPRRASPPVPRPASRATPTLRHIDASVMTPQATLPPRRQHRRRPRASATASSASTGVSTARETLGRLRDGGPSALRAAILHRILLEPPPGLRSPGDTLPELPSPPTRNRDEG